MRRADERRPPDPRFLLILRKKYGLHPEAFIPDDLPPPPLPQKSLVLERNVILPTYVPLRQYTYVVLWCRSKESWWRLKDKSAGL